MKISEMIKNLTKIKKEHGNLNLVYSIDDEGNEFKQICFTPTIGHYEDREFCPIDNKEDHDKINSCCVN